MIIFRYLAKEVLISMAAVTLVLLLIIMSGRFISYLSIAAAGEIPMEAVFYYLLYRMPGFLELILPLGLFLGILLAYGRLYLESEMVVLQATGMSQRRLTMYTLGPALFTALLVSLMSLYLSPVGANQTEIMLQKQRNIGEFDVITEGRFQTMPRGNRVTYIENLDSLSGTMRGVFISEKVKVDNREQAVMVVAEKGRSYTNPDTGIRYLVLDNGYRYEGNPGEADYRQIQFQEYGIRLPDQQPIQQVNELYSLPTTKLFDGSAAERAQLHWRLSLPMLTLIVALLAVPLSKTNPRQGRYAKLIPSILLYMAYLMLLTNIRKYIERDGGEVILLWLVHLLFFALAMGLLYVDGSWKKLLGRRRADHAV
ncbi:lipopolysaccharide export system permease protein [Amphritea atlantica]|uniref:Lipopolysaccharide export system permease protein LptF n=1 Tax=Amphritea atlantica TaxID=355243 RepID=A0A1H9L040_9GAMM|nr:LPS export ABC transporter permease LptF [Amphritea atlantica]SER04861.1 lipopolysaccharide export system permease protein [Amphritea atlantica]